MSRYKPQSKNVNRHTEQGTKLLQESIARDGFISAVTVAADGEAFDGSNRIQVGGDKFAEAIEVHTTGDKPVVVVRDDIPNTDDPKAKRLAVLANQITASDWNPDAALLSEIARADDVIRDITQGDAKLAEVLGNIGEPTLPEKHIDLKPRQMFRVLISVELDAVIDLKELLQPIAELPGVELIYGAN